MNNNNFNGNSNEIADRNNNIRINTSEDGESHSSYSLELPLERKIIAKVIKALRSIRNYSQTTLGRLLGVQKTHISKLEKGESNLTLNTLIKVLSALKANVKFKIEVDKKKDFALLEDAVKTDNGNINKTEN